MFRVLKFVIAFALLGFLFSTKKMIIALNSLSPIKGLIVYYFILFITLEILQWFGLIIGGVKIQNIRQTIGELLIIFAFFVIVDYESEWVAYVIGENEGKKKDYPVIYTQAEDGAVYYMWITYVTKNPEIARLLTYVLTPAVLVAMGFMLTGGGGIKREWLA